MKVKLNEKIKNLRKQTKLSQEGLAEQLHVSRQTVFKWESGKSIPDTDNVVLMSKLFNVPLEELLYDELELAKRPKSEFVERVEETQECKEVCVSEIQNGEADKRNVKKLWIYALVAIGLGLGFLISYTVGMLTLREGGYIYLAGMIAGFFTLVNAVYVAPFIALFYICQQALKSDVSLRNNVLPLIARFIIFTAIIVGVIFLPVSICIAAVGSLYGYLAVCFGFFAILVSIFTHRKL